MNKKDLHAPNDPAYQNFLSKELARAEEAADTLNNQIAIRRKMFESAFKSSILPILRAQIRNEPADMVNWMVAAGGPNREIEVVDAEGKGLFIVPPPFVNTEATNEFVGNRDFDIPALMAAGETQRENGEFRYAQETDKKINTALTHNPIAVEKFEALLRNIEIYHYYKLPMQELLGDEWQTILDHILNSDSGTTVDQKASSNAKPASDETDDTTYIF